ncbi:Branched-chain amino acid transport system 2 carrier protein [compost metagenome]
MAVSLLLGVIDALKGAGLDQWMPQWLTHLPLTEQGLAWLIPSVATLALMVGIDRLLGKPSEALA